MLSRRRAALDFGTEVLLGGGLVEIHVGRGIWQTTVAAADLIARS